MTRSTFMGISDAAQTLEKTREAIARRQRNSVILSRQQAIDAVFEAWQQANEGWRVSKHEPVISEDVMETACRFIESLPLGTPSPTVAGEPDGHISFEWYRNPRRLLSVSVTPDGRLYWAALIGSEDPRSSSRFADRIPKSLLFYISRVFAG